MTTDKQRRFRRRRLSIDRNDVVAVLNDLGRDGLVVREPDKVDRRRNVVRLTPTVLTRSGS